MAGGVLTRRSLLISSACSGIVGCNQNRKKRIAVIPKAVSHLVWVSVEKGAKKAGQEFNVDILWNGPAAETEFARQIQIVDQAALEKVVNSASC